MKNLFRFRYKHTDSAINLDKEENPITGESLNKLGLQIDKKFANENIFTIIKYEIEGILYWKIMNNSKDKDVFVNSRSNPTKHSEIKISPGEIHRLKMLLDEKIYFNLNNSNYDYLYFDKIKIEERAETEEIISRKLQNEPIDINNDELDDLFLSDDSPENLDKPNKKSKEELESNQDDLDICRIEDDEEEMQRSSIFKNEKSLEQLLVEYNLDENSPERSVWMKKNSAVVAFNQNESEIKNRGINVHNIQSIPTKNTQISQISKVKKIITDDEEEMPAVGNRMGINRIKDFNYKKEDATCSFITTPYKIIQSNYDDGLTESMLNEILEQYKEQTNKNCIENFKEKENYNDNYKSDNFSSNYRDNLIKVAVKQGNEFNPNNKRIRPASYSKEIDEHFSAFKSKRLKKATENKELKIDTNTTCAICLENITALANLDNCTHDFCKPCIIEWSTKYSNVCPLCKKDFKKIIYYEKNKKKELKVKKKKFKLEEEEDFGLFDNIVEDSADNCMVCNSNSDFPNMLVCDGCHYNVCHTYCDGLDTIPYEDWFCSECRQVGSHNRRHRQFLIDHVDLEDDDDEDDDDDSYEPQIQLNEEEEKFDEYNLDALFEDEFPEQTDNESLSSSKSNDSQIQITRKNKRGRPRKIDNFSNNSNNNYSNLSVNISVNVNMSSSNRTGRRQNKVNETREDYRMVGNTNNNILHNSNRNEGRNLNNIRLNSTFCNYSNRELSIQRNNINNFNNIDDNHNLNLRNNSNNFARDAVTNERSKRGRPKNI